MGDYTYKMVQLPRDMLTQKSRFSRTEAADYLQKIVNEHASKGWEFQRVDTFTTHVEPGCLGRILGGKRTIYTDYVATFRRNSSTS